MKARLINEENINSKTYEITLDRFVDCVSDGDKLVKIDPIIDEQSEWIGMMFMSGYSFKENIIWGREVIVTGLNLGEGEIRDNVLDKLIESDYILCFDDRIAMYVTDIKSIAISHGLKMGRIFSQS